MTETKVKKTLFLFDATDKQPALFELDGDYRRLDGVYINDIDSSDEHTAELSALVYHPESGDFLPTKLAEPTRDWTYFVKCGFME